MGLPAESRRSWFLALLTFVAILAFMSVKAPSSKVRAAQALQPYTVVRTENGYDKSGALRYSNTYTEAIRSDGSSMKMETTSVVQQRTIYASDGTETRTNERLRKVSTFPRKRAGSLEVRNPALSCLLPSESNWTSAGTETVAGYRTARIEMHTGARTFTAWRALDASCALVQLRFEHSDGVTLQTLTSLKIGEPDSSLFTVPVDFQEGPPSALYPPVCFDGGKCEAIPETVKSRMDASYTALRAHR